MSLDFKYFRFYVYLTKSQRKYIRRSKQYLMLVCLITNSYFLTNLNLFKWHMRREILRYYLHANHWPMIAFPIIIYDLLMQPLTKYFNFLFG